VARKRKAFGMWVPTIVMGVLAVALVGIQWCRGDRQSIETGVGSGMMTLVEIIPLLIFAFIVAGMIQAMVPKESIARWVGAESGFRGILVGTVAGGLCPGGPFVSLPIAVTLVQTGASIGTMVAFLTGWSLWAVSRLPMEVGILGWKLTLVRIAVTFFFPPIAGWLAQTFFGNVKLQ
jgi:uncharacterized membrane protein YraQ (UPF0718 family)